MTLTAAPLDAVSVALPAPLKHALKSLSELTSLNVRHPEIVPAPGAVEVTGPENWTAAQRGTEGVIARNYPFNYQLAMGLARRSLPGALPARGVAPSGLGKNFLLHCLFLAPAPATWCGGTRPDYTL